MYIIAPQIEKSSTPEYQAGEKVQKTANSFSSIFSEIVESKHSEKSTETIQTEKAGKNKQVNEKQQVDDKQIAEKIKSLDISKLSGLTKQEKQALYAKIEKLLEALKTGKDTKELFAAWTQGNLDLVIPLEVNQGQNVKNTVLLQLVFAGKGESTKSFNLNLLQMDSDGINENASKVLPSLNVLFW